MKRVHVLVFLGIVAWTVSHAQAQYGLSGAPEILPLPTAGGAIQPVGYDRYAFPPLVDPGRVAQAAPPATVAPPAAPASPVPMPAVTPARPGTSPSPPLPPPIPAPGSGSVINGMLSEAGNPSGYPGMIGNQGGQFGIGCADGPCNGCTSSDCCEPPTLWYGSAAGLVMARDGSNGFSTSYEDGNNPNQFPHPGQVDWDGGWEFKLGRRFCCGQWAIEANYWELDTMEASSLFAIPGGAVSTPLIVSDVEFGGVNGTILFDGAQQHRVWRKSNVTNYELNLIRARLGEPVCSPFDASALLGVRYFRFDDDFTFGTLQSGGYWGGDGSDEAFLHQGVENHLVGVQIGADAGWRLCRSLRAFVTPKLGIYNNHSKSRFDLYRGDGVVANPTAASGVIGSYPVIASDDSFSFLGQIDLGLDWEFCPHWTVFAGYRLVGATGIALADNQIPTYVVDIPELARVDTNGSLIVHGVFAGMKVEF